MNRQVELNPVDDGSRIRGYIMMGLSLLLPIILYVLIRSAFRYFLGIDYMPIFPMLVLFIANLGVLVYLHVIDMREMKQICGNTDKLLATGLVFQPAYFVCREGILGRTRKGATVYAVLSTVEIIAVMMIYVIACVGDVIEMVW